MGSMLSGIRQNQGNLRPQRKSNNSHGPQKPRILENKERSVGNASRPLRRGAPTGATSSGAMTMARDPGHDGLAFLHSSVFHFLSFLLLYTTIYLTISRITFISQFSYSFVIFLSCCPCSPRSSWAFYSRLRPRYDILSQVMSPLP